MKIIFFPLSASGHINPTLPIARELVSRGMQVVYYATGDYEKAVRHTGADFRRLDDSYRVADPSQLPFSHTGDMIRFERQLAPLLMDFMARGLSGVPDLLERVRAEKADCMVYDHACQWGRMLIKPLGLRAVAFFSSYALTPSSPLARELRKAMGGLPPPAMLPALLRLLWTSGKLRLRHGLPMVSMTDALSVHEEVNIVPLPRRFQPDGDTLDESFLFVGPSVTPRVDTADFDLAELERKPTLFISLGTMLNRRLDFYAACYEAFANTRWQVVLSSGSADLGSLGKPPANFIVRARVPQLEVLSRARLFLTHGGMNSTMEGLWYGVPLVVFPQMLEQAYTAGRVEELGLGRWIRTGKPSAQELRETVEAVDTQPSYRERLREFQPLVREAGGHVRAADAIERFLRLK
jgi:MGT family glycosyltransferase